MVTTFFRHSSMEDQQLFFDFLQRSCKSQLLTKCNFLRADDPELQMKLKRKRLSNEEDSCEMNQIIIDVLKHIPQDAPRLNFSPLVTGHKEINKIIKNSNNLQGLRLPNKYYYKRG